MLFYKIPDFLQFSFVIFLLLYATYSFSLLKKVGGFHYRELKQVFLILPLGFVIEWLGASTGFPFGEYLYTNVLGVSLFGVPVIMSAAWTAVIINAVLLYSPLNRIKRALWVGFWAMAFDLVMDPVAVKLNFWQWAGEHPYYTVPLSNFIAWFVISALFSLLLPAKKMEFSPANQRLFQGMLAMFGLLSFKYDMLIPFLLSIIFIIALEVIARYAQGRKEKMV
jgi:uncharacterized membrane protein